MKNILVSSALMTLLSLSGTTLTCPSVCSCNETQTDCKDLNQLASLDTILDQLPADTSHLILSNNNITTLDPGNLSNLSNIMLLDLSANLLSTINPGCFSNLSHLLHLDLSRNLLARLFHSSFSQLRNLEFLDLSVNLLVKLPAHVFSDLSSLTKLILRENKLKELSPDQFNGLAQLKHLDLSINSLSNIPTHLLDGLHNLGWLLLTSNNLKILERATLEPATALQNLLLDGNPWNCNCNLIPLKYWMEWIVYTGGVIDSINCTLPVDLHGKDLLSLPMELFRHCYLLYQETRRVSASDGHPVPAGECVRQRYRPVSVRRATATVVIAGVVCSVVCVLMVVTATYGCIYATLVAHQQQQEKLQENSKPLMVAKQPEQEEKQELITDTEKGAEASESIGWMVFPPEVCV